MKKNRLSELSTYLSLTYDVDFRDLDTVAGEVSTAVDDSAD